MSLASNPWPYFEQDEIDAVSQTLMSGKINYWTGSACRLFEEEFAAFCKVNHGVALANGSVAIELALRALEIGSDDEVVVTPRTFMASASSMIMCGAKPVFADIDPISQNITAETIAKVLTPRTKAIIAVHLAGWPCDMDPINELAKRHGLKVIEDCAQAHGAMYKGRVVGSFGDMAAFSFCNDKIITTGGEGGMLLTNDYELWKRAWSFKDHGRDYDEVNKTDHPPGFRWVCHTFGTNWRMTEMQAAIGRIQLRKLPKWLERRRKNAAILTKCFKTIPALRVIEPTDSIEHAYYKYDVFVRPEKLKQDWSRDRILEAIEQAGVVCRQGHCPEVYREKAFTKMGLHLMERLPIAKHLGETSLQFLVHPTLGDSEMGEICRIVNEVLIDASVAE
ncbi:MAG: DegT/DnrJ/EryC1/StrS aminotransferase family protein [Magnetococcus sp. DMHC-6]